MWPAALANTALHGTGHSAAMQWHRTPCLGGVGSTTLVVTVNITPPENFK